MQRQVIFDIVVLVGWVDYLIGYTKCQVKIDSNIVAGCHGFTWLSLRLGV